MPADLTAAPWNAAPLTLDGGYYGRIDGAPVSFNLIETIMNHIGLPNVLVAALPLLSLPVRHLTHRGSPVHRRSATKSLTVQFRADMSTISLLLDPAPINYLSNFNTRSNIDEILTTKFHTGFEQYHDRITWKRPTTGDSVITSQPHHPVRRPHSHLLRTPQPRQAFVRYLPPDVRLRRYDDSHVQPSTGPARDSTLHPRNLHDILAIVKRRVNVDWDSTMTSFFDRLGTDMTLTMGVLNYQDLCTQLHLAGVHTVEPMSSVVWVSQKMGSPQP